MVIEQIDYSLKTVQFRKPFRTAKGIFTHREMIEVTGKRSDGEIFTSEAVAFPEFAGPTVKECIRDLERIKNYLPFTAENKFTLRHKDIKKENINGSVSAALEHIGMKALHGVESPNVEFSSIFIGYSVKVNALLSSDTIDDAVEKCDSLLKKGYDCIKIKVGAAKPAYELEMISTLRNTFGNNFLIRLDANAGWSVTEAIDFLKQCSEFNIQYIEQPVDNPAEFPHIKNATGISIAADESLRNYRDALELARYSFADYFIIKPHFLGGLTESMVIAEIGKQNNIKTVVSGCLETSLARGITVLTALNINNSMHHGLSLNNVYLSDDSSYYPVVNGMIYFDKMR